MDYLNFLWICELIIICIAIIVLKEYNELNQRHPLKGKTNGMPVITVP